MKKVSERFKETVNKIDRMLCNNDDIDFLYVAKEDGIGTIMAYTVEQIKYDAPMHPDECTASFGITVYYNNGTDETDVEKHKYVLNVFETPDRAFECYKDFII